MSNISDLVRLAQKLVSQGPHKHERTVRRVRGLLNGKYAFDTINAHHVWENDNRFPQYYIPLSDFTSDITLTKAPSPIDSTNGGAYLATLTAGDKTIDRLFILTTGPLKDMVKVDFHSLTQWFEEDTPIYIHPKDPYKRIDILPSSRHVKVAIDGVTLAETTNALFLLETSLRIRHYLPPTCVNWEYLTPNDTETGCPYKGRSCYWDVSVKGKVYQNLVWCYKYPTAESAPIAGYLCFYNEMVDVWVDGVKEEK